MAATELLNIYLNDHLAGATAGSELASKMSSESTATPYGTFLSELARDIEHDRATLADLMDRLGIQQDALKQAGGWLLEKLTRLKLNEQLTGGSELKRLLEFETLSLGVEGKLVMWRALEQVSHEHPALADTDLDSLAKRADEQRAKLEEHRMEIAKSALVS